MKRIVKAFLLGNLLLSCLPFASGQQNVTFIAPKQALLFGQRTFDANIRVVGFQQVVGMQFSLAWDTAVLRLQRIDQFGLPIKAADHFDWGVAKQGMLPFAWYNESIKGITLPDSASLFTLHFEVLGLPNSQTPLRFTDRPTPKEVADTTFKPVPAQFVDGQLQIRNFAVTTSTVSNEPNQLAITRAFPNPFAENLALEFELAAAANLQIEILDRTGKIVQQFQQFFGGGKQQLAFTREQFGGVAGGYLIRLSHLNSYTIQPVYLQIP